jgi:hypothetical protein
MIEVTEIRTNRIVAAVTTFIFDEALYSNSFIPVFTISPA